METIEMYYNVAVSNALIIEYAQKFSHRLSNSHLLIALAPGSQRAGGPSPCLAIRLAFLEPRDLWHFQGDWLENF